MAQISGLTPVSQLSGSDLLMVNQGSTESGSSRVGGVEKRINVDELGYFYTVKKELTISSITANTTIVFGDVSSDANPHPTGTKCEAPIFINIDITDLESEYYFRNVSDCINISRAYDGSGKIINKYNFDKNGLNNVIILYGQVDQYMVSANTAAAIRFKPTIDNQIEGKTAKITAWSKKEFSINECIVTDTPASTDDNRWIENSYDSFIANWNESDSSSLSFIKNKPSVPTNAMSHIITQFSLTTYPFFYIIGEVSFNGTPDKNRGAFINIDLTTSPFWTTNNANNIIQSTVIVSLRSYKNENNEVYWEGGTFANTKYSNNPQDRIKGAAFKAVSVDGDPNRKVLLGIEFAYRPLTPETSYYITSIHGLLAKTSGSVNVLLRGDNPDTDVWTTTPPSGYTSICDVELVPNS